jgi:hypothetical protein
MKVNLIINKRNEVLGYRIKPLDLNQPTVDLEEFPKNFKMGEFLYQDSKLIRKTDVKCIEASVIVSKYSKQQLINAFIEYRNGVNCGIIVEDESTRNEVSKWYKEISDNNLDSMNNPPKCILKFLEVSSWI